MSGTDQEGGVLVVLLVFLHLSVHQSVTLKMKFDWASEASNHNRYTNRPSVNYAYYVTITCNITAIFVSVTLVTEIMARDKKIYPSYQQWKSKFIDSI